MKRLVLFFLLFTFIIVNAQVPNHISWQGILQDSQGNLLDGTYDITVRLFDVETDGTALWTETFNDYEVTEGLVNLTLGSVNPFNILFDIQYWLEIEIDNNQNPLPRIKLTSVPYSLNAKTAQSIDWDNVDNKPTSYPPSGAAGGDLTGFYPAPDIADGAVVRSLGNPDSQDPFALTDHINLVPGDNIFIENNQPNLGDILISAAAQHTEIKFEIDIDNNINIYIWNPQINVWRLWIIVFPNGRFQWFGPIWWIGDFWLWGKFIKWGDDGSTIEMCEEGIIVTDPDGNKTRITGLGVKVEKVPETEYDEDDNPIRTESKSKAHTAEKNEIITEIEEFDEDGNTTSLETETNTSTSEGNKVEKEKEEFDEDGFTSSRETKTNTSTADGIKIEKEVEEYDEDGELIDGYPISESTEITSNSITITKADGSTLHLNGGITIKDSLGNTMHQFGKDGTSFHSGDEVYQGKIIKENPDGSRIEISEDGILIYDGEGTLVGGIDSFGELIGGTEFPIEEGFEIPLSDGGKLIIDEEGFRILDINDEILTVFYPDGTSLHFGRETFAGGISISFPGTENEPPSSTEIEGGTATHTDGVDTSEVGPGLIRLSDSEGNSSHLDPGGIIFLPPDSEPDGENETSIWHGGGRWHVDSFFDVFFEIDLNKTETSNTTDLLKLETPQGVIQSGFDQVSPVQIISDFDGNSNTATARGIYLEFGGIEGEAVSTDLTTDGFKFTDAVGNLIEIGTEGIKMSDVANNVITFFSMDGTSYHTGVENFAAGINIGTEDSDAGWATLVDGTATFSNDLGNSTTVAPDYILVETNWGVTNIDGGTIFTNDLVTHSVTAAGPITAGEIITGLLNVQDMNVQGNLEVFGNQLIQGNSEIVGHQIVSGNQTVDGTLEGNIIDVYELNATYCNVTTDLLVSGNSETSGDHTVLGNMLVDVNMDVAGTHWVGGNSEVMGDLMVEGEKNFRIDYPLDPANKYLFHASIESNEVLNQYSGNIVTDANGFATVILPDYFEVINIDFRYQLTVIGEFAQAIIHQKINNNKFTIRTDKPNVEVSWQITAKRNDQRMRNKPFQDVRNK